MGRGKSPSGSGGKGNRVGSRKSSKSSEGTRNKRNRAIKRMRKSSLSKAQEKFQVFNQVDDHVNKYENLELDASDSESQDSRKKRDHKESHASNDILVIDEEDNEDGYDDYDGHYDSPRPSVPVVDLRSVGEEPDGEESDMAEPTPQLSVASSENGLEANQDYIAFSNSSEEEKDSEGKEEEHITADGAESRKLPTSPKRTSNSDFPWILNHDHSKQKEIADWLTMEIKDFVAYISPNRQEIEIRNKTISKIRAAVKELWNDADLHVFGSYATDLYLPGSDIDCVIISKGRDKENRNSLYSLASFLKSENLATNVEVIAKARVPIIKFVEPQSQIHIDVSFERINGLEAARLIREWLEETQGLRELVLIVKQFLHSRRLNNVHTGGLGGFSIICLVYSFLHLHPRVVSDEIDPLDNLGVLLIDFFELYGKNFGYDDVGLTVQEGHAAYIAKYDWRELQSGRSPFTLAIQDPGDPANNISRGSFNLRDIKKAFAGAFDLLTNRCFELDMATFKDRLGKSVLGNVIKYRGKTRDFNDERDLVENKAIVENEKYHKRRSRIIHEEVFVDPSSDDAIIDEEEDMYRVDEPPKKKRATRKPKPLEKTKPVEKVNKHSVDTLMGISAAEDEEDDGYNPLEASEGVKEDTADSGANDNGKNDDGLKKITVDAQTRRDYWLGKSNTLTNGNIDVK